MIELARRDLTLLPPAAMASRGAFESALKAAWLVDCDDHFDRELRWLQHLRSEERVWSRLAVHAEKLGASSEIARAELLAVKSFRERIESVFPKGYNQLPGLPSVEQMLPTLHDPKLYTVYVYLSQFMHGERIASKDYATGRQPRLDAMTAEHWIMPLQVCWLSLFEAGRKIISRLGGDPNLFMAVGEDIEIRNAIVSISSSG